MATDNYLTIDGEIVSETRDELERDYLPDPLGSTAALLDNTQTKTDTWTYDDANRLTGRLQSGARETLVHDPNGNMLVKHEEVSRPRTSTFAAAGRMVTVLQDSTLTTYTYDNNGNLTVDNPAGAGISTYTYDKENWLTGTADQDGNVSTYTHVGNGLRRSEHEPDGTLTTLIWDGDDTIMEKST